MGIRDKVIADEKAFESLLAQKDSLSQAAEDWGVSRASLQKIRARQPVSRGLITQIEQRARATDSLLSREDGWGEESLDLNLQPFSKGLINPNEVSHDPENDEFPPWDFTEEINIVPTPNWIPPNDSLPNSPRTVHFIKDQIRLHKCNEITLQKLARPGVHLDIVPNEYGGVLYDKKRIDPVWHCVEGTHLSSKAVQQLKILKNILETAGQASDQPIVSNLDDIIKDASEQSGLAEVIDKLEQEGLSIFGQRIATLLPWRDFNPAFQGYVCDKIEHGFFVIADSEFDVVQLTYNRWVTATILSDRMNVEQIRELNSQHLNKA